MATGTVTGDADMSEGRRLPRSRGVAGIAFLRGGNMRGRLAGGAHAVVTAGTRLGDASVIKPGCRPVQRGVARLTIKAGLHMARRLAGGGQIVVATGA